MKIVLKRRKHRNGKRPERKGSIKVRIVTLPTYEQHRAAAWNLMAYRDEKTSTTLLLQLIREGRKKEFDSLMKLSKDISSVIRGMQKGYDFFHEYHQADTMNLALKAINEVNPVFAGKRESACNTCERKNDCPFTDKPKHMLDMICPILRRAYVNTLMKVYNGEPTDTPLTQTDMANLAVKHLS